MLDASNAGFAVGLLSSGALTVSQGGTVISGTPNENLFNALSIGRRASGSITIQQFSFWHAAAIQPRVMAGEGRPPTSFLAATDERRGWPAFAGHDTGAGSPPRAKMRTAGW